MSKFRVKLGYAPTRRDVFSKNDAWKHKESIKDKLKGWDIELVDIEWLNDEGLLYDGADADRVASRFKDEGVDAIFSPHCNFGTEDAVARLANIMSKPILIWGPRDDAPLHDGSRTRDTQCGLFATSKILRRFGLPFTYIVNTTLEDLAFERGIKNFLCAAAVVKSFRNLRIGQIGTRPPGFWTMISNEGELLERFGIQVVPITLVEMVDMAKSKITVEKDKIRALSEEFKAKLDFMDIGEEELLNLTALKLAIEEWAKSEGCSAVAIQCWTALQDALGIVPCFINAELTDEGLPVVCETDIHGAVSSVMLQAAGMGSTPIFFADLTVRHPENDNAELLWHCGPFPYSLKAMESPAGLSRHFINPPHHPGTADWEIRGGEITICRFDGDNGKYSLFVGEGRGIKGPRTKGTYIWFEVSDWPKWEEKLIKGPYVHHVTGIHRRVASVLYEAVRYIPGLDIDLAEPTEEEICAWLRGK